MWSFIYLENDCIGDWCLFCLRSRRQKCGKKPYSTRERHAESSCLSLSIVIAIWLKIHFILLNPGLKSAEQDWGPSDQAAEQSYFLKEEFHYLDVTRIRKFTILDMFHCALACLRNNLCLSLNMASSRGTERKLWCELLSTDKNRSAENYHKNTSSHHFSILQVRKL